MRILWILRLSHSTATPPVVETGASSVTTVTSFSQDDRPLACFSQALMPRGTIQERRKEDTRSWKRYTHGVTIYFGDTFNHLQTKGQTVRNRIVLSKLAFSAATFMSQYLISDYQENYTLSLADYMGWSTSSELSIYKVEDVRRVTSTFQFSHGTETSKLWSFKYS